MDTYRLLANFIDAYSRWYEFHEQIEAEGKAGNLDPNETRTLMDRIGQRDSTRSALLARLRQLGGE